MTAFDYRAIDVNGKIKKGVLEGDSIRQVNAVLRDKALTPLEIQLAEQSQKRRCFRRKQGLSYQELTLVTRQMATLIAAGIPLADVLSGVAEQSQKVAIKQVILGVRAKVLEGYSLAAGLSAFPAAFPRLYCTSVAAGEKSGKLDQVLVRLADYIEKQQAIKRKIAQAMIYPVMMTVVCISVVLFMLVYIVPKIVEVFHQTQQSLPAITEFLISTSILLKKYGIYLLTAIVVLSFAVRRLLNHQELRCQFHRGLLAFPILGKAMMTMNAARFARTFGILTAASVSVLEAMNNAARLINPLPMQSAVLAAVEQVREGSSIHKALQKAGYFSPLFLHLLASGEASGELEVMLEKVAEHQESEVSTLIEGLLTLFEPLMILVMGGVVLFIVLAIMLPIFALDNFNG